MVTLNSKSILKLYFDENEWLKPLIGVLVLFILCVFVSPTTSDGTLIFLKFENLSNILRQVSENGIIAVGLTLVIIAAGIDLSVGSILALTATVTAFGLMDWQLGFYPTLIVALLFGAIAGFINGFVTAWGKMQSFIATLAMMTVARGFALFISGSNSRNIGFGDGAAPDVFRYLTPEKSLLGIPYPVYIFISVTIIFVIILQKTRMGRYIYAIGSNEEAAKLAGLRVKWIRTSTFVISGLLAGLAGIIHSGQLLQGNPNDGVGFELDAIAAVVIGGTSLMGGKGSIKGTFAGVLIIGLLSNILGLYGIEKDFQLMLKGIIIVGAVYIQGDTLKSNFLSRKNLVFIALALLLLTVILTLIPNCSKYAFLSGITAVALLIYRIVSDKSSRVFAIIVLVVSIIFTFYNGNSYFTSSKEKEKMVIGFSQCNSAEPWREAMNKSMMKEAGNHPEIELRIVDAQQSNSKQIADIENFIVSEVDLLIVSPNEAKPMTGIVEKAYKKGIPVIIIDRSIESDNYTCFIGADNYLIGKSAGEYAAKLVPSSGVIVEISGLKGSTPAIERHNGFVEGLKNNPELEIIYEQDGQWLRRRGVEVMENALQIYEKIDIVYCHNDPMGVGAYLAAKNANRNDGIYFIGIDALPGPEGGIQSVINGELTATFMYPTGGGMAIKTAVKILKEEKIEKKITLQTLIIDSNNAEEVLAKFSSN